MMRKITALTLLLSALISSLQAQERIPFQLNNHYNILVKALINDVDSATLMFQIAMREGSLAPDRKVRVESVKFDTTEFPEGLSKVNRIQVANTKIDSVWIWNNEFTGYGADGKVGIQLFNGKVFKINYDKSQFELYDQIPDTKGFVAVPLVSKRGQLFVQVTSTVDNNELPGEFLLQSGFSGALLYNNAFADTHALATKLPVKNEKTMKNSAGDKLINLICELPALHIGGFDLKDVPVNVMSGDIKNQPTSYMGADLIHRFNWIIDIKGKMAYIQKNKNFDDAFYFNRPL